LCDEGGDASALLLVGVPVPLERGLAGHISVDVVDHIGHNEDHVTVANAVTFDQPKARRLVRVGAQGEGAPSELLRTSTVDPWDIDITHAFTIPPIR
jgi:hypothetical protein